MLSFIGVEMLLPGCYHCLFGVALMIKIRDSTRNVAMSRLRFTKSHHVYIVVLNCKMNVSAPLTYKIKTSLYDSKSENKWRSRWIVVHFVYYVVSTELGNLWKRDEVGFEGGFVNGLSLEGLSISIQKDMKCHTCDWIWRYQSREIVYDMTQLTCCFLFHNNVN